jgi:hypothetical protein
MLQTKPSLTTTNLDIEQILKNYANQVGKYEYDCLLVLVRQNQLNCEFVRSILGGLGKCVYLLEPQRHETFISLLIFDVKWQQYSTDKQVLALLKDFLVDLCSAYASYLYKCLHFLIKLFTLANVESCSKNQTDAVVDCKALFDFAHGVIDVFMKISPTSCKAHIVKLANTLYPYMIKDTQIQDAYMQNLLRLIHIIPDIRLNIFEICVQKMLKIDVNAPRDQIINAETELNTCRDSESTVEIVAEQDASDKDKVKYLSRIHLLGFCCSIKYYAPFATKLNTVFGHLTNFRQSKIRFQIRASLTSDLDILNLFSWTFFPKSLLNQIKLKIIFSSSIIRRNYFSILGLITLLILKIRFILQKLSTH